MLTDYQSKIEEMTRQLSEYAAKTTKCEDQKATIQVNLEKLESEKADCLNSHETVNREKVRTYVRAEKELVFCEPYRIHPNALYHCSIHVCNLHMYMYMY